MVESAGCFPFRKLYHDKFLILDVMMFVEHQDVLKFMFAVNKQTRAYLTQNFSTIQNGFINEGLITYDFDISNNENNFSAIE